MKEMFTKQEKWLEINKHCNATIDILNMINVPIREKKDKHISGFVFNTLLEHGFLLQVTVS